MEPPASPGSRPSRLKQAVRWTLVTLSLVLLAIAGWIRFRFGPVTLEQILLNVPTHAGENAGSSALVMEAGLVCLGLPLVAAGLAMLAARRWRLRARRPLRRPLTVAVLAFTVALSVLLTVAGVPQYATAMLANRSIAPYYVRPAVTGSPAKPRNLVTIYLESGENTFADESIFGQNLLSELDRATAGWASFDGLQQYPGGGWTMSGVVATECGIPLKSRLLTDAMNLNNLGEHLTDYLPGATCLGDILKDHGYTSVFLGGAHTHFAGKGTFLADHGYDRADGLAQWEARGESRSEIGVWGLSDHRLFANAEKTLDRLQAAGQPFNLTLLTLDTHEPGGVFPSCTTSDKVQMATAIKCSMRAVAGFLDHLRTSGVLDDTVVVVLGDHLKATSEGGYFKDELDRTPDRTIIFRVWSPDPVSFSRERADQLSVLPTTLELLGFDLAAGRAGLGVSFVEPHPIDDTALELADDEYRAVVTSPSSELYRELWGGEEP